MYALSLAILALPLVSATAPTPRSRTVVHESREAVPSGYVKVGVAPLKQTLTMRLGLKKNNAAGLDQKLLDISTPSSANYGKFLTKEEIAQYTAPSQETVDAVNAFLANQGVSSTSVSPAGDIVQFEVTVEQANALFSTQYDTFRHTETNTNTTRTLQYSLPASVQSHVTFVHPTTMFPVQLKGSPVVSVPVTSSSSANLSTDAVPASCSTVVTPTCIQDFYGLPTAPANNSDNFIAVSGFIEQFANAADLQTFLVNLRPDIPSSTNFTLEEIDGGQNPQSEADAGVEANLDTQMTVGLATNVTTVFISVGEDQTDDIFGFMDLINFLLDMENPPSVLTTSYGSDENGISASVANDLCDAYMQLGARGTTILFSSGDGGVSGSQSQTCTTFIPTFPSGCPYVTSVGATTGFPETSADFSSGGFSNIFPRPSFQDAAVSAYLTTLGDTNSGLFNTSGRAFPDIAAIGNNTEIVFQQQAGLVAGTSVSSPVTAAVIALLNDELESAGKSRLGFLNPFIYSTGSSAFNDITTGSNPGCNTDGFPATTGWDPVTGFGTPNFAALRTAVGL